LHKPWSLELCDWYSLDTHMHQIAHLPILPLTAILYLAKKEQPDVTSCQLNSLSLACNWLIPVAQEQNALCKHSNHIICVDSWAAYCWNLCESLHYYSLPETNPMSNAFSEMVCFLSRCRCQVRH